MKIKLCFLLFFVSAISYGQLKIGATAGVQITNLNVRYDLALEPTTAQLNPLLGILFEQELKKNFSITGEVDYAPFSYKSNVMQAVAADGTDLGDITRHSISYLHIPVAFNYNAGINKAKLKVGIGPALNIKLGDKISLKQSASAGTGDVLIRSTTGVAGLNTAFYMHTGVEFSDFLVLLNAQKSLTGIFESSRDAYKFKGYSFGISISYFFKK